MSLNPEIDDVYVGSTTAFRKRKYDHKTNCCSENSEHHNRYVYRFIRENCGWKNWSMVVIKAYPDITSKMELLNKERKWMKKLNATLNQCVPGNKLTLGKTEYDKQRGKQYYKLNTELIREKKKKYYELNKDKILEHKLEKIECECGCMISRRHIASHKKSKKHIQLMNDQ
jgi:hypothetical protein